MQRIEILRETYLPIFRRLSRSTDRPIKAACEIHYGAKLQSPGSLEEWPGCKMALLQGNPPSGSQIFHKFDPDTEIAFQAWYQQAAEAANLFGDWLKPLGLDPRIVKPRWAGCWFTLFCGLSSAGYPFPVSVSRKLEICDFIVVARDPNPLILQPVDDVEGKPGKCFASSELIFVDDLLKATELAIHCIIEAAETRKPINWCAGPSHWVCDSCGFERNADPYCPPTRCLQCGKEYPHNEPEPVRDEIEADDQGDRDAIGSAALRAVVDSLATACHAVASTRSADLVTAIIRERVAADRRLYWWRADDWVAELKVSKPTVTDSVGWREIMKWRAANKADRVSKKTGK